MNLPLIAAGALALCASGWFLYDLSSDNARLKAELSAERLLLQAERRLTENLELSIGALSQSNRVITELSERADLDVAALRAIPSEGACGAPVHAAVDMLRVTGAAEDRRSSQR